MSEIVLFWSLRGPQLVHVLGVEPGLDLAAFALPRDVF